MSETPETDQVLKKHGRPIGILDLHEGKKSQQLERERDKWRELAGELAERLGSLEYEFGNDRPTTWPTCASVTKALKRYEEANKL